MFRKKDEKGKTPEHVNALTALKETLIRKSQERVLGLSFGVKDNLPF